MTELQEWFNQTCVYLDLDNFGQVINEKPWPEYSPNPITKIMTTSVKFLISRYFCTPLWGLDEKRGTEECILLFEQSPNTIMDDLRKLQTEIKRKADETNTKTSLSIGVTEGKIKPVKPFTKMNKSIIKKYQLLYSAYNALKSAKKQGGNTIVRY